MSPSQETFFDDPSSCNLPLPCCPFSLFHLSYVQHDCHLLAAPAHLLLHHCSLPPLDPRAGIFASFMIVYGTQQVFNVQAGRGNKRGTRATKDLNSLLLGPFLGLSGQEVASPINVNFPLLPHEMCPLQLPPCSSQPGTPNSTPGTPRASVSKRECPKLALQTC